MRLLLDEHHDPEIARHLRALGHDVVAIAERQELRGRLDHEIFELAVEEGRALATEDVKDHAVLARRAAELGRSHLGVVFTSRYSRDVEERSRLIEALRRLLDDHSAADALQDVVMWL